MIPTSRERVFITVNFPLGIFMGEIAMNDRTIKLIGEDNLKKIQSAHILVVGLGGVGGTAVEALIRSGVEHITIIDADKFDASNLNRQILATKNTINMNKTEVCEKRILEINSNVKVKSIPIFLDEGTINELETSYDFIIDACDSINTKVLLVKFAKENNCKIISSMGTGKRLNPEKLKISTLNKTYNDPLAKIMRHKIKEAGLSMNIPVVFSEELPMNNDKIISSMIFVPSTAGILLANYVIESLINK